MTEKMRLIDARALIEQLKTDPVNCPGCPEPEWMEEFCQILEAAPAVEAIRRGEWKGYNIKDGWLRSDGSPVFLQCSLCGGIVLHNGSGHWNYCPNCGADNRGSGDGKD